MSAEIQKLILESTQERPADLKETFAQLIQAKIRDIVEERKVEVAASYFGENVNEEVSEEELLDTFIAECIEEGLSDDEIIQIIEDNSDDEDDDIEDDEDDESE